MTTLSDLPQLSGPEQVMSAADGGFASTSEQQLGERALFSGDGGLVNRRSVLAAGFAAAALGFASRTLGVVGRAPSALAGCVGGTPGSCSHAGNTFRTTCSGTNSAYATSCSAGGCDPRYSTGSPNYCYKQSFGSPHRTCGEDLVINGTYKQFRLRKDECYGGGYDGWNWAGVDNGSTCGCTFFAREWSCNDGWVRSNQAGSWCSSICVQNRCP